MAVWHYLRMSQPPEAKNCQLICKYILYVIRFYIVLYYVVCCFHFFAVSEGILWALDTGHRVW